MKKNLLLLGAALLMTASAMAQSFTRVYTMPAPPTFTNASSYNYAAPEGGDELYLWNVKYGGFYSNIHKGGTDYYGTRAAAVDTIGAKITFTRVNPDAAVDESTSEWIDADGNDDIYLLVSYVDWTGKNANMCTFADNWAGVWTDNNSQAERYFHVKQAGNYLRISHASVNEATKGWDQYNLCVRPLEKDADKRVYIYMPEERGLDDEGNEIVTRAGFTETEDVGEDWAIVAPAAYDTYMTEETKAQIALYVNAQALRLTIEKAQTEHPGIDLSALIAIYNNTASTSADLIQAKEDVAQAIVDFESGKATADNPVSLTEKINNPTFTDANVGGWQGGNWGRNGAVADCAEHWHASFDHYQDLTGLQEGVYRIVVDGFNRINDNHNDDYVGWKNGENGHARLYLSSTTYGEYETPMKPASAGGGTTQVHAGDGADTAYDMGGGEMWYAPNSMLGFVNWIAYWNNQGKRPFACQAYGPLAAGDVLRIGARNTVNNEWVIVDNFELWYLGNGVDAYLKWAEDVANDIMPQYNWDEVYYGQDAKDYYDNIQAGLTSATSKEQVIAAVKDAPNVASVVGPSIEAYAKYVAEVDGFAGWAATQALDQSTDEFTKLAEYMEEYAEPGETYPNGSASYIIDYQNGDHAGTLTTEQILAEIEFIEEMKGAALGAGLFMGTDLSYLIKNPTFAQTASTATGRAYWDGTTTFTDVRNTEAEMFNKNFDIWQDINDDVIKPGLYEVNIKAFYRTASNGNAWAAYQADPQMTGDAKVHSYVYLNEFASPVRNVMEIAYDTNLANNCYSRSDGKFTLDGMNSAHEAFALEDESKNFTMKVYGLVTEDEAGHIRLGLRNETGTNDARWTLFGHFGIRYMDKSDVALKEVIEDYLTRYDNISSDEVGTDEFEALDAAYTETDGYEEIVGDVEVKDPNTGEIIGRNSQTLYDMLMNYVKAYNAVEESGVVYAQLTAKADEVKQYAEDHQYDMDESVFNEVMGVVGDVNDKANEGSKADFEQRIADLEAALEKAKLNVADNTIDWDGELPIDATTLITNPEYEAGTNEGWSGTAPAFNYGVAEVFNNKLDIYQDITVPKAGWYVVSVRAFDRIGDAANDYTVFTNKTAVAQAFQYVVVDGEETTHSLSQPSLFAVPADEQANFTQGASDSPGPWATVGTEGYAIPNNMGRAAEMFNFYKNDESNLDDDGFVIDPTAGYYYVGTAVYVAEPGTVRIGLRKETNAANSWCIWDDWKLWYYGDDLPTGIDELKNSNNLVAGPTQRSIYTLSGARVQGLQKGINIIKTVDAQGNVKTQKIFVK